jgi:hypothetical protein
MFHGVNQVVGSYPHGMTRLHIAERGTALRMERRCECIESTAAETTKSDTPV